MQEVYFGKRAYSRREIADVFNLDPSDKNFAAKVKTRLQNLGFNNDRFIYSRTGVTILWTPDTYEEKITYLVRLLGIDPRVDPQAFSVLLYRMALDSHHDCDKMPWIEKAMWIKDVYDIDVHESTLRRWVGKMLDKGLIFKDTADYQWWISYKVDGETFREPVESEEDLATMKQYWSDYSNAKRAAASMFGDIENPLERKREQGKWVFNQMWSQYHCKYYRCCSFCFGAWDNNPAMKELRELIIEHMEQEVQF